MTAPSTPGRRALLFAFLVVVAGGLVLGGRWGGLVPYLTPDTINDFKFVQDCCSFHGIGTSVGTMVHGANWLHTKALAEWAGVGDVAQHWILHALLAVAMGGLVLAGARVRGLGTGLLSVLVLLAMIRVSQDFRLDMTYNHRPMPLLGVLFLMSSLLAVETGRRRWLVLAGIATAAATNVHTQAILQLPSLLWIAWMVAPGRLASVAVAAGSFGAFAFLTSPGSWILNLAAVGSGGGFKTPSAGLVANAIMMLAVLAAAALVALAAARLRDPAAGRLGRGHVLVVLATVLPRVAAFLLLASTGRVPASDKYLIDVFPAVALGLAWGLSGLAGAAWRWSGRSPPAWPGFAWLAPVATAGLVAVLPPMERLGRAPDGFPVPTRDDVEALHDHLVGDLGWNAAHALRGLQGPRNLDLLDALVAYHPETWAPPVPPDDSSVMVFKVDQSSVPNPLPPGWLVLHRERDAALVVVPSSSWLDWGRFEVCEGPPDSPDDALECRPGGIAPRIPSGGRVQVVAEGMPRADTRLEARMVLRIPVSAPAARGEHVVFMPRIRDRCGGLVTQVRGEGLRRDPDGRRAFLSAAEGGGIEGLVTLEFRLGSPECGGWSYSGFPPFVVEAPPATVAAVASLLDAQGEIVSRLREEESR